MFDYIVVVVSDDSEVKLLERSSLLIPEGSTFVPVSESAWHGPAGNGLGTLFALKNASTALGRDLVEEVNQGKSVLIVHTAGEGTRNILTRTCKNKSLIKVPAFSILEGLIKQFQELAIPSRILVTWGDQFLLFVDSPEEIRDCAQSTHVMLFGLKTLLTEDIASTYGIQTVRCEEGGGCELLEFDDSRNYEVVKRKVQRHGGDAEVMVNMGMFTMSGVLADAMLSAFRAELEARMGKFSSDELWQLWISHDSVADSWLNERAENLKEAVSPVEPYTLIKSFPLSDRTLWRDFGTNERYYNTMMNILADDDAAGRLRAFLGLEVSSFKEGCDVSCSVYKNATFDEGVVTNSVTFNATAKHVELEEACVINSTLNMIRGKRCVIYNVIDYGSIDIEDCFLVDVFHPRRGRIRLTMRIGEEKGAKETWWHSCLPGNERPLCEIAELMQDVSVDEMERTKRRFEELAEMMIDSADRLKTCVEQPLPIKPFVENKPWGYELWCVSPRNYCEIGEQDLTLDELTFLFSEPIVGTHQITRFPLIVKIIKADENLSVQTHPDDAYAQKRGDVFGKEEAWHVLEALQDAKIYLGFGAVMKPEEFPEAVTSDTFLSRLSTFDAHIGDTYHIPAGVIHALGAGTKVYEASTASERTFRIYDYGRGRELHLADAQNVLRFDEDGSALKKDCTIVREENGFEEYLLLEGEHFELRLFKVHDGGAVLTNEKPLVLTCVQGEVTVTSQSHTELSLTPTDTVLVSACVERFELQGEGEVVCARYKNPD
jgi:mannose-6-phosphate isomerase